MTLFTHKIFDHKNRCASLRQVLPLMFAILSLFTSNAGAWAAPSVPDAPFGLYLPSVSNEVAQLETLETSVVHLNQNQAQVQSDAKSAGNIQALEGSLLPAPPPGQELHPAQADADAPTSTVTAAVAA